MKSPSVLFFAAIADILCMRHQVNPLYLLVGHEESEDLALVGALRLELLHVLRRQVRVLPRQSFLLSMSGDSNSLVIRPQ
jgi:hypothetical protein